MLMCVCTHNVWVCLLYSCCTTTVAYIFYMRQGLRTLVLSFFMYCWCHYYIILLAVSVVIDEMLQPDDRNHSVKFGSNITLNCSHEIGASVRWYVNSKVVDVRRPSSLLTVVFSQPGVYLCQVTTSEVDEEVRSVLLCGIGKLFLC